MDKAIASIREMVGRGKDYEESVIGKFFEGKTILITGASMGIGEAMAYYLAKYKTKYVTGIIIDYIIAYKNFLVFIVVTSLTRNLSSPIVLLCVRAVLTCCKRWHKSAKTLVQNQY